MRYVAVSVIFSLTFLAAPALAGNDKNYTYLALGDSIAFGMNPLLLPPYSTQPRTPAEFTGYPEIVAKAEHLLDSSKEVNAACPGETSGSFLITGAPDYGCNSPHYLPSGESIPAFKTSIGLHTNYAGTQMDFAVKQLTANKHINLVTLSIGANDGLLLLQECHGNIVCVGNGLGGVLQNYAGNLTTVLSGIRANYQGTLILMKYYSPSPALDGFTAELNDVMTQVATQLAQQPGFRPVIFADGFTAFYLASALLNHGPSNHDACKAGLLIRLPFPPETPCDIHPSPLGRDLLAATVEFAQWTQTKH